MHLSAYWNVWGGVRLSMGMQIAIGMEISLSDRMLAGKAWTGHQRVLHRNCLCVARTIAGLSAVLVVQRMFWWTMKTMNDGWCSVWDEWGWFYVKFSTSVQAIWNVNISMYHHTLKKSNDITHIMQPFAIAKIWKQKINKCLASRIRILFTLIP